MKFTLKKRQTKPYLILKYLKKKKKNSEKFAF